MANGNEQCFDRPQGDEIILMYVIKIKQALKDDIERGDINFAKYPEIDPS